MSSTIERYEALCKKHGVDPNALPDVSRVPEERKKYNLACERLAVVSDCLNAEDEEGNILEKPWEQDHADPFQRKYELIFEVVKDETSVSGFGLASDDCADWAAHTTCGGRLRFASVEKAKKAFAEFKDYYEDMILPG